MIFNEDSRVKIPTILHLIKLGYSYLSLKNLKWDPDTNICTELFFESIKKINPELTDSDIKRTLDEISLCLEYEDLGKAFYEKLTDQNNIRLIDFNDFNNNSFHVVTEFACIKDDEEFRPDITLLINGMPLVFIEVKKPNNKNGVNDEYNRLIRRFQNKKFRKFINITQLMIFSNNMEYSEDTSSLFEGAFYATTSYKTPIFNFFREEETEIFSVENELDEQQVNQVLKDNNLLSIKNSPEFITNNSPFTPTNKICSSILTKERLAFFINYGLAYVKSEKGTEKHVMRYPQYFATKAIAANFENGVKSGIVWHTQGSGKTALTYFNVKFLTDFFQKKNVVPKFYFIVDRIDLLIQSAKEFRKRDLVAHEINSREEFSKDIKATNVIHNNSGKSEITVVNIQKFADDPNVIKNTHYNVSIQRIYFLDEVHRSYNPKGSFLANLQESDKNAYKIGLTGTPLLGNDYNSKMLFGSYFHKYYYNSSIKDGYTLRLIREEIETAYKMHLNKTLDEIQVLKGDSDRKYIYSHPKFVEPMLDYIVQDFEKARLTLSDDSIGAMVVCDSSDQAKALFNYFEEKYAENTFSDDEETLMAAEEVYTSYSKPSKSNNVNKAALILHDIGTKDERKKYVDDFKDGKIDILFVYNMLLTGFDAPRLKKLYLGRIITAHNLLQTLTRVNRTYKNMHYGYVVDFADIQKEFEKTNRDYFNELQSELGDETEHYSNLFKSEEEINTEIQTIREVLFPFDTKNKEVFLQQIQQINDKKDLTQIAKALNDAKSLYNLIRLSGKYDLLDKLDFRTLSVLSNGTNDRLKLINAKEALENKVDTTNILNLALEDVVFAFVKVKEEEMLLADQLKNILQQTREVLGGNFDQADPVFISLREELERLFKKKNLNEVNSEEMISNIKELNEIYSKGKELERKNQLMRAKYDHDAKYARIHKRLMEKDPLTDKDSKLFEALSDLKRDIDAQIEQNTQMLENENFVEKMILRFVIKQLNTNHQFDMDITKSNQIKNLILKEYMNEFNGKRA